jgi:hypothetical protein
VARCVLGFDARIGTASWGPVGSGAVTTSIKGRCFIDCGGPPAVGPGRPLAAVVGLTLPLRSLGQGRHLDVSGVRCSPAGTLRRHASSEREKMAAQYSVNPSTGVTVSHADRFQQGPVRPPRRPGDRGAEPAPNVAVPSKELSGSWRGGRIESCGLPPSQWPSDIWTGHTMRS